MYTARELRHQLADSGASALIVLDSFGHVAEQALEGTAVKRVVITSVGDLLTWPKSAFVNFTVRRIKKMVKPFSIPGARRWNDLLAAGRRQARVQSTATGSDLAQLQYTGGTTGVSKGAMLEHRALIANVSAGEQWLGERVDLQRDISLICLPLYHIAAYTNMLYTWTHGVHGVLVTNPRDIGSLIKAFRDYRPAIFSGVNTLYDALMNSPDFGAVDLSSLKLCVQGGTALRRATAERWKAMTGHEVVEMYGLSETSAGITVNRWDGPNPVGSIGLAWPGVEVSLRDEAGNEVAADGIGELCVRGAQVTRGYWQRGEEDAEAFFPGGWFRTGDIARQDDAGYLFLLDRRKDMILVSGFNVFPNEVEDVVALHPGVLEVAAVGVPDEKCGEAVKLVVVKRDPNLDEASLRAHCREQLTGYKQPKLIEFRDSLPKSAVGKILRRELR
jgi:long-chain acyl-CoA synthetase